MSITRGFVVWEIFQCDKQNKQATFLPSFTEDVHFSIGFWNKKALCDFQNIGRY
jgi:hypothetical protein